MSAVLILSWGLFFAASSGVGSAQAVERAELVAADLAPWREPRGDWRLVGEAALDPTNPRRLIVKPGSGVLINVPMGGTRHLFSTREYGDVEAQVEFMVPKGSNSGVYFQGRYEIQICDSWGQVQLKANTCAAIYQRWTEGRGYEGSIPSTNASRPPGEWQTLDVVFRAPRFDANDNKVANARFERVVFNGVQVHPANLELSGPTRSAPIWKDEQPTGPLMLQGDHGPVAFRRVRLRPLSTSE